MVNNGEIIESVKINGNEIYLRANAFFGSGAAPLYGGNSVEESGTAYFEYSFDNSSYKLLGNKLEMLFSRP